MTTIPPPAPPAPEARPRRPRRSGPVRILFGYLVVAVAAVVGSVGLLVGFIGADQCTAEGFECLGWLFIGAGVWIAISTAVLFVLAHLTGLGWQFVLVTLALFAAVAAIPGEEWLRFLVAALAPLVAALLTSPRTPARAVDGSRGPAPSAGRGRLWVYGVVGILVLSVLLVLSVPLKTLSLVNYRVDRYELEGVQPVGLSDDRGWTYSVVIASDADVAGLRYRMDDDFGNEIRVEIEDQNASSYAPPQNCSPDPHRSAACDELAEGVWADAELANRRVIATAAAVVTVQRTEGPMTDAELTQLAGELEPQTLRWLATRDCRICRFF
ncbi:MAG: hypothetical protein ACTH2Q_15735 [Propionibacteriaceae bacterium]